MSILVSKISSVTYASAFVVLGAVAAGAQQGPALPDAPSAVLQSTAPPDDKPPVTLRKLPLRFVSDQVAIVTSPLRVRKTDLKWMLPLAGATAAALTTDSYTMRNVVSRNTGFNDASGTASNVLLGAAIGTPALMYVAGSTIKNEAARETGLLAGEAMIDAFVVELAVKYTTLRERPYLDNANGNFFSGNATSDPSFISGHSTIAWSSAAVLAQEFHKPWQQATIYTLASGASLTRVMAQKHFPTDVLLGSAAGWLIGHYVYKAHHRPLKR